MKPIKIRTKEDCAYRAKQLSLGHVFRKVKGASGKTELVLTHPLSPGDVAELQSAIADWKDMVASSRIARVNAHTSRVVQQSVADINAHTSEQVGKLLQGFGNLSMTVAALDPASQAESKQTAALASRVEAVEKQRMKMKHSNENATMNLLKKFGQAVGKLDRALARKKPHAEADIREMRNDVERTKESATIALARYFVTYPEVRQSGAVSLMAAQLGLQCGEAAASGVASSSGA